MKLFTEENERAIFCAICAISLLAIAGCSKKSAGKYESPAYGTNSSAQLSMKKTASRASSLMADTALYEDVEYEMAEEAVAAPDFSEAGQGDFYERKLIRTGNISLEVQTLSDAEDKIAAWAKTLGGYVTNANTWEMGASFTVRVPAQRFDDAMAQAGDFGRVTNRSVNSEDVSDNYYDMKSRLETKYILRDKLNSYLGQAKNIKDLLEIERQLNQVIQDIESTESRFKRLSGQIDYSTIYINMQFERGKDEGGVILPDFKNAWNEILSKIVAFFWGLVKVLFYLVIFGVPVLALIAFFFWLLFGKVGLLVKLFKKLKK